MSTDRYVSPLSERYASKEMQYVFSPDMKFKTWRRLWIALAETEKELGLDITDEQISAILAKHHEEINAKTKAAEDKFSAYKAKADKYDQEQADTLSEQEKYQKLMEEAAQIKAENTRLLNRTKVQEKFVKAGIKEECYSPLLDRIVSDDEGKSLAFADSLISSFSANAAAAAEAAKQAAMQTPAPNPGAIGNAASAQEQYNKAVQNGSIVDIIKAADAVHNARNIPTD